MYFLSHLVNPGRINMILRALVPLFRLFCSFANMAKALVMRLPSDFKTNGSSYLGPKPKSHIVCAGHPIIIFPGNILRLRRIQSVISSIIFFHGAKQTSLSPKENLCMESPISEFPMPNIGPGPIWSS